MNIQYSGIPVMLFSIVLMLTSSAAFASFSYDEMTQEDPYHVGKITYHRKLACSSCPLSNTIIDASVYKSIVQRINNEDEFAALLNEKERTAVTEYLEQLFTPR
jgi:hypothetical protein